MHIEMICQDYLLLFIFVLSNQKKGLSTLRRPATIGHAENSIFFLSWLSWARHETFFFYHKLDTLLLSCLTLSLDLINYSVNKVTNTQPSIFITAKKSSTWSYWSLIDKMELDFFVSIHFNATKNIHIRESALFSVFGLHLEMMYIISMRFVVGCGTLETYFIITHGSSLHLRWWLSWSL